MESSNRHHQYRTFGACPSFAEADAELRRYGQARTLEERMEALEELRILNHGETAMNAPIPRVFGVPQPCQR